MRASLLTLAGLRAALRVTKEPVTSHAVVQSRAIGTIDPEWLGGNELPIEKIEAAGPSSRPAVAVATQAGATEWKQPTNFPCALMVKDSSADITWPRFSGTSFPSSPVDGQRCTRTDHGDTEYVYSSARSGWLSVWEQTHYFAWIADVSTSIFVYWAPGAGQFTATYGPIYGFQTMVTGIGVYMNSSGTCQVGIYRSGSAITGATLSLSTETSKTNDALTSTAVAAGGYLGAKRDSGTVEGPGMGYFTVRRFET